MEITMPTVVQIVSRYLFNQDTPPANLKDDSLVRPVGVKEILSLALDVLLRPDLVWWILFVSGMYYVLVVRMGLPSDEEMIAHFQAHKPEIEELVRRYRSFEMPKMPPRLPRESPNEWLKRRPVMPREAFMWDKQHADTEELLRKASIDRLQYITLIWFPNPYSMETAKKLKVLLKDMNNFDPRYSPMTYFYKYGALTIDIHPWRKYHARSLIHSNYWKNIVFFPETPRIMDGWLLGPLNTKGEYSSRKRVLPTLDSFPPDWKEYECVFRRIEAETNWFLHLCNGH
jgi:hypothetical protein